MHTLSADNKNYLDESWFENMNIFGSRISIRPETEKERRKIERRLKSGGGGRGGGYLFGEKNLQNNAQHPVYEETLQWNCLFQCLKIPSSGFLLPVLDLSTAVG